ncbi:MULTISPECIES: MFS transporter [unclassified Streptomyces]|uniref:MFS transporter n=1 Tax=unclassified Streptomyces TaxID=2593676 RepID=UPI003D9317E8
MASHAANTPTPPRVRARWIGLLVACLGQMVMFVNITQTTATLAPIQQDLHVPGSTLVWMASIYSVVVASFVLSAGTVGDIVGRRRIFALGALLLGAGSLTVSLSPGSTGVLIGEAIMGLGGAAVLPNSLSIVTHLFTDAHERTRAVGIWAAVSGIGLGFGPVAAGVILERYSWHAVFLVNVVLAAIVLLLTPRFVAESRHPGRHLDPPGLVLAIAAIGALNYGVIDGGHSGFDSARALWAFVVAALALVALILVEARTRTPMLKLRLFRIPSFATANVVALIVQYGFVATAFAQVLYLERVRYESILRSGLLLLPLMLAYVILSSVAAPLSRVIGFKATLGIGALLAAAGNLLMINQDPSTSLVTVGILMAMFGAGAGLILPPVTAVSVISVPHTDGGMASGTVNLFRQVGGTLGATITGTILTSGLTSRLPDQLTGRGLPRPVAEKLTAAVSSGAPASHASAALRETINAAVGGAFSGALHLAVLIPGAAITAGGAAAVILIRNRPGQPAASPVVAENTQVTVREPDPEPQLVGAGTAALGRPVTAYAGPGPSGRKAALDGITGTVVHGFVRDVAGASVGAATLTLISLQGRQLGRTHVGPDGRYALTAPAGGSYVLITAADGRQPQAATVVLGDAPLSHDVILSATSGLTGVVCDAADGRPVTDAMVVVTDVRGEVLATATTGESGTFTFNELASGTLTVAVNAAAYRPAALPIEVGDQGITRLDVDLSRGAVLRGTVRAGAGRRPLPDARVTLVDAAGNVAGTAITGDDGSYAFTDLDSGDYTLTASGYPPVATSLSLNGPGPSGCDVELGHPHE